MWPSSAPAPIEPRYGRPPRISPPPIPVPSVRTTTSDAPAAGPQLPLGDRRSVPVVVDRDGNGVPRGHPVAEVDVDERYVDRADRATRPLVDRRRDPEADRGDVVVEQAVDDARRARRGARPATRPASDARHGGRTCLRDRRRRRGSSSRRRRPLLRVGRSRAAATITRRWRAKTSPIASTRGVAPKAASLR